MPNEIVPLKISKNYANKLRGIYSNIVYGESNQKYFVHYLCFYLYDAFNIDPDIYFDRTSKIDGYVPYSLCIVTRYPYHNSFLRILDNFININNKNSITNEIFIQNLYDTLSSISFNNICGSSDGNNEKENIIIECPNDDNINI